MFGNLGNTTIEWKRCTRERFYEMRAGGRVLATLRPESASGRLAIARAGARYWILRSVGFLRNAIRVRSGEAGACDALYQPRWNGRGELTLAGGRSFTWGRTGFWDPEWAFSDASGRRLLAFRPGMTGAHAALRLTPEGATVTEAPLLAVLGWFLLLQTYGDVYGEIEDASTVAAVGAGAAP